MKKEKIAAVVVTYNRVELLCKCIDHLLQQTFSDFDIIVIDNKSTDNTAEKVKEFMDKNHNVIYKNTGANLGGAGGFSYGIKYAVIKNYDYLWIMDDDTIPELNALEELINAHKLLDGNYGFLSSYAVWKDETPCEMNVPGVSLSWRENIQTEFDHSMIRLDSASFVSMYVPAKVVREVGLPIKEFFIWADDVEYSRRISKKYPCYFVYKSKVVHEMAENKATSIVDVPDDRLERFIYLYRNRYYIAKHGSKREKWLFWLGIKNTLKDIKRSSCSNKKQRKKIVLKSCWKGIFFNPSIEYIEPSKKKQ